MSNNILKTKHKNLELPAFFPTIGWPGGRGEYDYLFKNLKYFSEKINNYNFLFNFSSFIFGFTIPNKDFHSGYTKYQNKDIRNILKDYTNVDKNFVDGLIILLDCGGNRVFNKIIKDNLQPLKIDSYKKYLQAYKDFIKFGQPDIFVNFDIGPSYTTRDIISIKGAQIWDKIPTVNKNKLNYDLLEFSIEFKNENNLIMIPISANNIDNFNQKLNYLFNNYKDKLDIIGIAGIAQSSLFHIEKALKNFYDFKKKNNWEVFSHGLGLGGLRNIPLLVKYEIDSCDVATPWRRACTDRISSPYIPFLDSNLEYTNYKKSLTYSELYNDIYSQINCKCPFCMDLPLKDIRERCMRADKYLNGKDKHDDDFREMRIRIFFHNVFQHIALLKKLFYYKNKYKKDFMIKFKDELSCDNLLKIFSNPLYLK